MFQILFWVIRFQILIVGFTLSFRNIRNSASHTFLKNKYMSAPVVSSISIFAIISITSQLKAGALK